MSGLKGVAVATTMDVFSAFAGAVVTGVYSVGSYQQGTVEGDIYRKIADLDVIVDEGNNTTINYAPNSEPLTADLLLYVKPGQLPTTNTRALCAGYMIHDKDNDDYFAIIRADVGKNQDEGELEHIELYLRQTDVILSEESES